MIMSLRFSFCVACFSFLRLFDYLDLSISPVFSWVPSIIFIFMHNQKVSIFPTDSILTYYKRKLRTYSLAFILFSSYRSRLLRGVLWIPKHLNIMEFPFAVLSFLYFSVTTTTCSFTFFAIHFSRCRRA